MQLTVFLRDNHGIQQPLILISFFTGNVTCIFCCASEVLQWSSVHWEPHFLWLGRTGVQFAPAFFNGSRLCPWQADLEI